MASEALHVARDKLSRKALEMHYAITSPMAELEADAQLREYLFSEGSIVGREEDAGGAHGL